MISVVLQKNNRSGRQKIIIKRINKRFNIGQFCADLLTRFENFIFGNGDCKLMWNIYTKQPKCVDIIRRTSRGFHSWCPGSTSL